jgi:hypothetical protein
MDHGERDGRETLSHRVCPGRRRARRDASDRRQMRQPGRSPGVTALVLPGHEAGRAYDRAAVEYFGEFARNKRDAWLAATTGFLTVASESETLALLGEIDHYVNVSLVSAELIQ